MPVVPFAKGPPSQPQAGPQPSMTDLAIAAHMLHTEQQLQLAKKPDGPGPSKD